MLLDEILNKSRVKKFALVNVQHSDRSFERLVELVKESLHVRDLDISWSNVRPQLMLRLLTELPENTTLESLNLSYN